MTSVLPRPTDDSRLSNLPEAVRTRLQDRFQMVVPAPNARVASILSETPSSTAVTSRFSDPQVDSIPTGDQEPAKAIVAMSKVEKSTPTAAPPSPMSASP